MLVFGPKYIHEKYVRNYVFLKDVLKIYIFSIQDYKHLFQCRMWKFKVLKRNTCITFSKLLCGLLIENYLQLWKNSSSCNKNLINKFERGIAVYWHSLNLCDSLNYKLFDHLKKGFLTMQSQEGIIARFCF